MVAAERDYPPIIELSVVAMALVIAGGIYMASYLPKPAPLGPALALLAAAALVLIVNLVLLRGLRGFDWDRFFLVARWTLLAYIVISGLLAYIFITDGTRGGALVVLLLMLIAYAVDIPLLLSFSVARYTGETAEPGRAGAAH